MSTLTHPRVELPTRIRKADGSILEALLAAEIHQRLQLGMLHQHSAGFIEITPGTRPPGEKVHVDRRRCRRGCRPAAPGTCLCRSTEHFLDCAGGPERWMGLALGHIAAIQRGEFQVPGRTFDPPREEVFVGVTPRAKRNGNKKHVDSSRWIWVDCDHPDALGRLWAFLERRPPHLVVLSGGSGGAHAYWQLAEPAPATVVNGDTGELVEPVERANERIIHHLGHWQDGPDGRRVFVGADRACKDRSRIMRVAGTVNYKTGEHARVLWADLAMGGYTLDQLVGDLDDMPNSKAAGRVERRRDEWGSSEDPYKRIPPADYFERIAGIQVPRYGNVSCPHADHDDRNPSCRVGTVDEGWICHGCGANGGIYDLASAVLGGPTGHRALRGEDFRRARTLVVQVFGELT